VQEAVHRAFCIAKAAWAAGSTIPVDFKKRKISLDFFGSFFTAPSRSRYGRARSMEKRRKRINPFSILLVEPFQFKILLFILFI